jgi:ferric-dicitrate binding protein FerR (iron transport regulator)
MANRTVNLNKNATVLMGENTKVRVRVKEGVLQIRPTGRQTAVALPKGEVLIDLRDKKQAVRSLRFTLPHEVAEAVALPVGAQFLTVAAKHGWLSLTVYEGEVAAAMKVVGSGPKPAGGSVSDR